MIKVAVNLLLTVYTFLYVHAGIQRSYKMQRLLILLLHKR